MTIQPTQNKVNGNGLTLKSVKSDQPNNAKPETAGSLKDNLNITEVAKEITKALESSKNTPAINSERVEAVKKALAEGSYPINAEKIAAKMIQMERQQFNDSR